MHFLTTLFLFLASVLPVAASTSEITATLSKASDISIDTLFYRVPMSELPLLAGNPRLDMLDRYNCGMKAYAENIFERTSVMEEKNDRYIRVKLTAASRWELVRLASTGGDEIYACTHTLLPPVSESRIKFYNSAWQPLDTLSLTTVALDNFWTDTDSVPATTREELRRQLQSPIIYMEWEETSTLRPTVLLRVATDRLGVEERKKAELCLKPLRLRWNGDRFVRS